MQCGQSNLNLFGCSGKNTQMLEPIRPSVFCIFRCLEIKYLFPLFVLVVEVRVSAKKQKKKNHCYLPENRLKTISEKTKTKSLCSHLYDHPRSAQD